jgi:hypothetical protein
VNIGDTLRVGFAPDTNGTVTYDEITIVSKESDTLLKFEVGDNPGLGSTPLKIEIWRTLDSEGLADEVGTDGGVFASRRVFNVYPDLDRVRRQDRPGYHLAAALAGLIGGVVPHQGLTNITITGFDNADQVINHFNRSQLDRMASAGRWIVTHDLQTGAVYTRQELMTDPTDLNTRELMVVKNVDSISYVFRRNLAKFIGRSNVTPSMFEVLKTEISGIIEFLKSSGFTARLGGQLIDAQIAELKRHVLLRDRVVCTINLLIPYPLNHLEIHLVI